MRLKDVTQYYKFNETIFIYFFFFEYFKLNWTEKEICENLHIVSR